MSAPDAASRVDAPDAGPAGAGTPDTRHRAVAPGLEVLIVLGLSLGQSAVYSVLSYWEKATRPQPIGEQTTSLTSSWTPDRPWLDLSYQLAGIVFPLVPAFLALYLLRLSHGRGGLTIGFDLRRPGRDVLHALLGLVVIGGGGIAVYAAGRALGVSTRVDPANLAAHWWTVPVYLGMAWMNGMLEEVVMVGYAVTRLREKRWSWVWVVVVLSLVRATYHLYQGWGGFAGNLIMGALFTLYYARTRRVMPLVLLHFLIDALVYLGYPLVATWGILR